MKKTDTAPKAGKAGARQGSYVAGFTAIAIAICIIINVIVAQLPSTVLQPDISGNNLYQVSDTTRELTAGLTEDVEIIVLSAKDSTDNRIVKFLANYEALSDKLSVSYVDTVANPAILAEYSDYGAAAGSVLVTCQATGKTISVLQMGWSGYQEGIINYDYYTYYQSYASTGTGSYLEVNFDADGQITSAVNYVTSEVADGVVYTLSGHGEADLPAAITSLFTKDFLQLNTGLDLLTTQGGIPEDCDLLVDYAPATDLADDELTILQDYLRAGGRLVLLVYDNTLANYSALLADYGLVMDSGAAAYVADESRYYAQYASSLGAMCFDPVLSSSSDITKDLTSSHSMLFYAYPITEGTPYADTVTLDAFMTSSDSAVRYTEEGLGTQAETFLLGVVAQDAIDEDTTARLTVFATPSIISEGILGSYSSFVNADIFMNAVTANFDEIENISIESVSLDVTYNTIPNALIWTLLFVIVIPAALLIFGIVHWVRRRKK